MFDYHEISVESMELELYIQEVTSDAHKIVNYMDNLIDIQTTVESHGLDEQLINLLNRGDELTSMLKISIDELDVEAMTEGIADKAKDAINWIIKKILNLSKLIKDTIRKTINFFKGSPSTKLPKDFNERIEDQLDSIDIDTINRQDYGKRELFFSTLTEKLKAYAAQPFQADRIDQIKKECISLLGDTIVYSIDNPNGIKISNLKKNDKRTTKFKNTEWNDVTKEELNTIGKKSKENLKLISKTLDTVETRTKKIKKTIDDPKTSTSDKTLKQRQCTEQFLVIENLLTLIIKHQKRDLKEFESMVGELNKAIA